MMETKTMSKIQADLIIVNIGQLLTVPLQPQGETEPADIGLMADAAVAVYQGKIVWVGTSSNLAAEVAMTRYGREIDARNRVVTPLLVDAHTHISGYPYGRADDFVRRVYGETTYAGIACKGG